MSTKVLTYLLTYQPHPPFTANIQHKYSVTQKNQAIGQWRTQDLILGV